MSPRTVERVDGWESVPFGGGYGGLRDLASREFSGVVTVGPARLFMIRGTAVGVLDGSIEDFEGADGTAREAPHPALPLLAVMQEHSDEVRAQYYTEDTPIADVDRTLEDGGFTGYVELSENVLSGDYYQVYHQGRSMSVAYVGSSERLITDDEAFEQANDEVGIYEVRPVDVEPVDIPEPTDDEDGETPAEAGDEPSEGADDADAGDESAPVDDAAGGAVPDAESAPESEPVPDAESESEPGSAAESAADGTSDDGAEPATESATGTPDDTEAGDAGSQSRESGTASAPAEGSAAEATDPSSPRAAGSEQADARAGEESERPAREERSAGQADSATPDQRGSPDSGRSGGHEQAGTRQGDAAGARADASTTDRRGGTNASRPGGEQSTSGRTERPEQRAPSGDGTQAASHRSAGATPTESAGDLEVRSIPSLDPSRTEAASKAKQRSSSGGGRGDQAQGQTASDPAPARDQGGATPEANRPQEASSARASARQSGQSAQQAGGERPAQETTSRSATASAEERSDGSRADAGEAGGAAASDLQAELESREQEIADLQTDLERVEAEREELESTNAELEAERDRLESELEEARTEIERLEARLEDFVDENATDAETQLSANQAIDETNLFVRYDSKGEATLETAHAGDADRAAVIQNLRLEYHTQFDADNAAVGNQPFEEFLTDDISYRFVEWLVEHLLYEIRDTGHADGMAELYDALPKIDRAELNGQVSVQYTEDGEEHRTQERFDVVVRDRMGNPLVVANINDSRDPATDAMMTDLVKRAERVGESSESLAAAFLVTASFFEPESLETADEATSSGLFSRDKRKSFVNLSRKDGYHLCLVEARNRDFHLAVPEL